ncbi:MAG TPA: TonB-dependent receptor [Bryobacteraceae bacterium]|nr:TonB-dependent receptor [Bryobacteraceae bacterium]
MPLRCFSFFLLLAGAAAFAQSDRGTITGTVSDPQNAMVPQARVSVRNADTAAEYQTITTATGDYTISQLPAGNYQLSVAVPGFKNFVQHGIVVQAAQSERINVTLQVGSNSETVSVTAEATLLKTENAEQAANITADRMNALPLNFAGLGTGNVRDPYVFMNLTPGAAFTVSGITFFVRVNGAPANSETIRVDGQEADNTIQPGSPHQTQTSVEAMQEVSVQTSNFAAEYGQVSGGMFNFTMRSGTNQYHGSLYDYFTNEDLNAGIPFTNSGNGHLLRPPTHKNDFGGSAGGPLRIPRLYNGHDKTFFFFNWESYIQRQTVVAGLQTVPTVAMQGGDFSSVLTGQNLATDPLGRTIAANVVYDPATNTPVNGQTVRNPFPGNIIPMSRMDPVALKLQALLPQPQTSGNTNNFNQVYANPRTQWIPSIKVDHSFGEKLKASFFWSWYNDNHYSGQDGLSAPLTATRYIPIRSQTYRLSTDYSLTPTLLIHVGVGELLYHNPDKGLDTVVSFDAPGKLGLVGGLTNQTGATGFPRITGLGSSFGGLSLSLGPTNNSYYRTDKPTGVLSATLVRRAHTFKAGAEYKKDIYTNFGFNSGFGNFGFSAAQTGLPSTNGQNLSGGGVGFGYASFLLGLVNSASVANAQDPQMRKQSWGLYVQDNWKVTRKLTLDYGLRWDWQQAPHEIHDLRSMFAPSVPNPSAGGLPGATVYEGPGAGRCNCQFMHPYLYAIGPRLGMAYQITPKTVIRAGWGLTYGTTAAWNFVGNNPIIGLGSNTYSVGAPSFDEPATTLSNGLHYSLASLYAVSLDPGIKPSAGQLDAPPALIDPNGARPPRINQWNVSLQREVTKDLVVEAAYVGNRGVWETANALDNLNALTPQRLAAYGLDPNLTADRTLLTSTFASGVPQSHGFKLPYTGFPTGQTLQQALRPFPQFSSSLTPQYAPIGNSWYDALQVKATKRFSHGLSGSIAFTWQKELDLGSTVQDGTGGSINDAFNRRVNKDISSFSQPFVFVPAFNYEIPGAGSSKLLAAVTKGWQIGGILRYSSGLPIAVPGAQNNLNSVFFQSTFVNRVAGQPLFTKDPNCHCIDPNKDFVLNAAAWSQPAAGQWGTAAAFYNDYRWARRPDEQASLGRIFRFRERMYFQIRAEFFNVFNRTFLNNPTSGNSLALPVTNKGVPTSGFGYINSGSVAVSSRTGQLVARFQF